MAEQPTMEERFALLEARVAELERQRRAQEDRDVALLARVDDFTDNLRRVERVQLRGFEGLRAGQDDLRAEFRAHQEYVTERFGNAESRVDAVEDHLTERIDAVEEHLTARLDTVEDHLTKLTDITMSHKEALEALYKGQQSLIAGQQQILERLGGKPKTND